MALNWGTCVEDNLIDFANKAVELYSDNEIWSKAQQSGFKIINTVYDKKRLSEELSTKINEIQESLIVHRNQNFIGTMLQHHSLQSTKYLSKWIEEKNKG